MAVSYTHLDVYKRQLYETALLHEAARRQAEIIRSVKSVQYELPSLMPVSYTHLDVYKRQGCRCVPPAGRAADAPEYSCGSVR